MDKTIFDEVAKSISSEVTNEKGAYDKSKTQAYLDKLIEETEEKAESQAEELINSAISFAKMGRPETQGVTPQKNYILSLDGGGTRGIMQAIWLQKIEEEEKIKGKYKISDIFTAIGGTSIGGILALAATLPEPGKGKHARMASTLVDLFTKNAARIFPPEDRNSIRSRFVAFFAHKDIRFNTYKRRPLENLLKEYLGDNTPLRDALTRVKVTSVTTNHKPICFSREHDGNKIGWEIGCATSAAPTYFATATIGVKTDHYVDGGLWVNNPAAMILADELSCVNSSDDLKDYVVLSLGTGKMPISSPLPDDLSGMFDGLTIAGSVISTLMDTQSKGVHRYCKKVLNKGEPARYLRINPIIKEEIKLDNIDDSVFKELKLRAEEEYNNKRRELMNMLAPRLDELSKK
jgi:predicted acylesterase/phospholipase RssA